jgi:AraC family transcriptional regulator of adaptative response/methylated-DNA-[protein]-cysteine methyltransferase
MIERAEDVPSLDQLAKLLQISPAHFHRAFKAQTGMTPKAYAAAQRAGRVRRELAGGATVTRALYRAGYKSNGRFYASSSAVLGMKPNAYRAGGRGETIRFAIGECWLGSILVAATDKGICAILLGDDPEELVRDLQDRFRRAELVGGDEKFEKLVARVVGFVEQPAKVSKLPLDIRGTAFQQEVWQALCKIPTGTTASYAEVARRVGRPASVRAVGQAIAANPIAVAIPCHRVVRTDGSLCGYRWGVERKKQLQTRERA